MEKLQVPEPEEPTLEKIRKVTSIYALCSIVSYLKGPEMQFTSSNATDSLKNVYQSLQTEFEKEENVEYLVISNLSFYALLGQKDAELLISEEKPTITIDCGDCCSEITSLRLYFLLTYLSIMKQMVDKEKNDKGKVFEELHKTYDAYLNMMKKFEVMHWVFTLEHFFLAEDNKLDTGFYRCVSFLTFFHLDDHSILKSRKIKLLGEEHFIARILNYPSSLNELIEMAHLIENHYQMENISNYPCFPQDKAIQKKQKGGEFEIFNINEQPNVIIKTSEGLEKKKKNIPLMIIGSFDPKKEYQPK